LTPNPARARFAAIAIALPVAHSLTDYPLRTVAISSLFAVAAAILALHDQMQNRGQGSVLPHNGG
jgi:hypothetical protein